MIIEALHKVVVHRQSLSREEAFDTMTEVLSGKATNAQIAGLLVALHMREETVEEIVGFAEAIRRAANPIAIREDPNSAAGILDLSGTERDALVDTCGTGGDASGTFNISTAAALVVAGAGVRVAKHGNRSVTSNCGSADVIEALGVNLLLPANAARECLRQVGMVFLFAPLMHSAMKHVQRARTELRLRTVFNLLGPLTNPAHATAQVVGVYSSALVEKVAQALLLLGVRRALVVHGCDGLDEITITGPSKVAELRDGEIRIFEVTPEHFGLERAPIEEISGGAAGHNASLIREILEGKPSARRNVVLMNAAAALLAAGRAESLSAAMPLAMAALDSGAARRKLRDLVEFTNRKFNE